MLTVRTILAYPADFRLSAYARAKRAAKRNYPAIVGIGIGTLAAAVAACGAETWVWVSLSVMGSVWTLQ